MNKKTKTDLVEAVAEATGVTKAEATKAVDAVFASITKTLADGDELAIPGFGKFTAVKKPARTGRNPSTGASIEIAASTAPKFAAGKALKDAVNV